MNDSLATDECPCGYLTHPTRACRCREFELKRYHARVSGPLLDRIDLSVNLVPVRYRTLSARQGESSAAIHERVIEARARMRKIPNAARAIDDIRRETPLTAAAERLMEHAVESLGFSARAHTRALRVARTIADLAGSGRIDDEHVAEGLGYRVEGDQCAPGCTSDRS